MRIESAVRSRALTREGSPGPTAARRRRLAMLERLFRKSNLGIRAFRFKKGYALCYFSYDGSGPEGLLGTAQSDFNYTCSLFRQKASAKDGYDVVLTQAEDSYVIVVTTSYGEPRIAPLMDMLW